MLLYYMEILTTFIILSTLSLLFLPFFGGCLGAIIFILFLGAVLVFSSIHFLWLLLVGLVFYVINVIRKYYKWRALPTSHEYLEQHPNCRLSNGVGCYNCSSSQLRSYGLFHTRSKWRFYTCTSCGTSLFRFTVL